MLRKCQKNLLSESIAKLMKFRIRTLYPVRSLYPARQINKKAWKCKKSLSERSYIKKEKAFTQDFAEKTYCCTKHIKRSNNKKCQNKTDIT